MLLLQHQNNSIYKKEKNSEQANYHHRAARPRHIVGSGANKGHWSRCQRTERDGRICQHRNRGGQRGCPMIIVKGYEID